MTTRIQVGDLLHYHSASTDRDVLMRVAGPSARVPVGRRTYDVATPVEPVLPTDGDLADLPWQIDRHSCSRFFRLSERHLPWRQRHPVWPTVEEVPA